MLDKIKHWFRRLSPETTARMATPVHQLMRFQLCLHQLEVGNLLLLEGGIWQFSYAEAFRRQARIKPLVGFPDVNEEYRTDYLWPFFASRIPSPNQPYVRERAQQKKLDLTNPAEMLREFGKRTITNPYALQELVEA